jgi:hypothetical protein
MDRNDVFFNKNVSALMRLALTGEFGGLTGGFRLGRWKIKINLLI